MIVCVALFGVVCSASQWSNCMCRRVVWCDVNTPLSTSKQSSCLPVSEYEQNVCCLFSKAVAVKLPV